MTHTMDMTHGSESKRKEEEFGGIRAFEVKRPRGALNFALEDLSFEWLGASQHSDYSPTDVRQQKLPKLS